MMKFLKITGIVVGSIVALIALAFLLLPSQVEIERKTTINTNPKRVFHLVNSMKKFNDWSPWYDLDPDARYFYEGPDEGVGAKLLWESEKEDVGKGTMWIVESLPNEYLKSGLKFEGFDTSYTAMRLEKISENETRVSWTMESNLSGFTKVFGLFLDGMVGPDYEKGLENLKALAEKEPENPVEIVKTTIDTIFYLGAPFSGHMDSTAQMQTAYGDAFGKVRAYFSEHRLETVGPALSIIREWDEQNRSYTMVPAMPIASQMENISEGMETGIYPGGKVIKARHLGAYDNLATTYYALDDFAKNNGLEIAGVPVEIYLTGPAAEPDTAKWVTEVIFPIKA